MAQPAADSESAKADWAAVVQPVGPHDGLSFDELATRYNFGKISSFARVMANVMLNEVSGRPRPVRLLDVGCGCGVGRKVDYQWAIKHAVDEMWGIDPDENVAPAAGLFDHFHHASMETSQLPENWFDLACSTMVMEHVSEPETFIRAVHRCLKPGGSYVFCTPNGLSSFAMISRLLHQLAVDELVLRVILGKQKVGKYHYPLQYKFNTPRVIDRWAQETGYSRPEYVFVEAVDATRGVLRGPLRPIYHLMRLKRRVVKSPRRLATLICRMSKPV